MSPRIRQSGWIIQPRRQPLRLWRGWRSAHFAEPVECHIELAVEVDDARESLSASALFAKRRRARSKNPTPTGGAGSAIARRVQSSTALAVDPASPWWPRAQAAVPYLMGSLQGLSDLA